MCYNALEKLLLKPKYLILKDIKGLSLINPIAQTNKVLCDLKYDASPYNNSLV